MEFPKYNHQVVAFPVSELTVDNQRARDIIDQSLNTYIKYDGLLGFKASPYGNFLGSTIYAVSVSTGGHILFNYNAHVMDDVGAPHLVLLLEEIFPEIVLDVNQQEMSDIVAALGSATQSPVLLSPFLLSRKGDDVPSLSSMPCPHVRLSGEESLLESLTSEKRRRIKKRVLSDSDFNYSAKTFSLDGGEYDRIRKWALETSEINYPTSEGFSGSQAQWALLEFLDRSDIGFGVYITVEGEGIIGAAYFRPDFVSGGVEYALQSIATDKSFNDVGMALLYLASCINSYRTLSSNNTFILRPGASIPPDFAEYYTYALYKRSVCNAESVSYVASAIDPSVTTPYPPYYNIKSNQWVI